MSWELLPAACETRYHQSEKRGGWGYVDRTGQWIIKPRLSRARVDTREGGYAGYGGLSAAYLFTNTGWALTKDSFDECYYYIGKDGKRKLNGEGYKDARACTGPTVFVTNEKGISFCLDTLGRVVKELGKVRLYKAWDGVVQFTDARQQVGFLDPRGNILAEPDFYDCSEFHFGLAAAFKTPRIPQRDQPTGHADLMYDEEGQFHTGPVFPYSFLSGRTFHGMGEFIDYRPRSDGGLVNRQGKFVIKPRYQAVSAVSPEGWVCVGRGDSAAVLDTNGNIIVPWRKDSGFRLNSYRQNPLVQVLYKGDWYVLKPEGNPPNRRWSMLSKEKVFGYSSGLVSISANLWALPYPKSFVEKGESLYESSMSLDDTSTGMHAMFFRRRKDGSLDTIQESSMPVDCRYAPPGRTLAWVDSGYAWISTRDQTVISVFGRFEKVSFRPDPGQNSHYVHRYDEEDYVKDWFKVMWRWFKRHVLGIDPD